MTSPRLAGFFLLAAAVAALEAACRTGLIDRQSVLPPSEMVAAMIEALRQKQILLAVASTGLNVLAAALMAILGGFAAGVTIRASRFLRNGIEPLLVSYYAVPTFIFYPVFVVLFGVGKLAIIAIAFCLGVVAMITATLTGLDAVPPVLMRTATVMRLGWLQRNGLIMLPATLPHLFTGARLAIAYAFIGVIASEFILSGEGLGYDIAYAYNNFDNRPMYGLMLLVLLSVAAINAALDAADRHLRRKTGQ
jgi:NitT/TauT family transport system permease protein